MFPASKGKGNKNLARQFKVLHLPHVIPPFLRQFPLDHEVSRIVGVWCRKRLSIRIVANKMRRKRRNTHTTDPHLLRERAKDHIRRREWERALKCLDLILREPDELPLGEVFTPNKQVWIFRSSSEIRH